MSKKDLKVKVNGQVNDIISYLESIVKSFKEGTVVIQDNDRFVTLKPYDDISLKIEGEQKSKKEALKIELSWRTEEKVKVVEETPVNLVISSQAPEIESVDNEDTSYSESKEDAEASVV